jgi:hypothetical protein
VALADRHSPDVRDSHRRLFRQRLTRDPLVGVSRRTSPGPGSSDAAAAEAEGWPTADGATMDARMIIWYRLHTGLQLDPGATPARWTHPGRGAASCGIARTVLRAFASCIRWPRRSSQAWAPMRHMSPGRYCEADAG